MSETERPATAAAADTPLPSLVPCQTVPLVQVVQHQWPTAAAAPVPPFSPLSRAATPPPRAAPSLVTGSPPSLHPSAALSRCDSAAPTRVQSSSHAVASPGLAQSPGQTSTGSASRPTATDGLAPPRAGPKVVYFENTKAGLQSVDKEKTEALIRELSKNSSFYINEERKAQRRQKQIDGLLVKTRQYEASVRSRPDVFRQLQREVAEIEAELEAHRHFNSVFVHMDMDMFYAAVEMKKNPHYAQVPLGIGGMSMLSTTNYIARQYGVRSGMPGFIGVRLCPQLVIVPTDFPACRVESAKFKGVVREYDPTAQGLGMDEIMMCLDSHLAAHHPDATTHAARFDAAEAIIETCRRRVAELTGLTASAGIAPTPTLAKMASNYKKPNGQSAVRLFSREAVMDYLAGTPVRQVPGIGKSQESILAGLDIHTLGDIYAQRHRLYYILTRKTYEFLLASAVGVGGMYDSLDAGGDRAAVAAAAGGEEAAGEEDWGRKSVGHERTFSQLKNRMELQAVAYKNLRKAHATLVEEGLLVSQVVLKLKYRTFHVKQHSKTLNVYTDVHDTLQRALDELLLPVVDAYAEFRLLGVRLEKLRRRPGSDATAEGGVTTITASAETDQAATPQPTLLAFFARQRQQPAQRLDNGGGLRGRAEGPGVPHLPSSSSRKRVRERALSDVDEDCLLSSGSSSDELYTDLDADAVGVGDDDHDVLVVSSGSQLMERDEEAQVPREEPRMGPCSPAALPSAVPCGAVRADRSQRVGPAVVASDTVDDADDDDVVIVD